MLKIFVLKKHSLYIALAVIIVLIISIAILIGMSGSDETFSETTKYVYKEISAEQAKILFEKNTDAIVLDIRDEEDYTTGHIPNATQTTYSEIKKQLDYLNKEAIYVIYGSGDKKSGKAASVMANNGFPKIYILTGDIDKWPYSVE